MANGWVKVTRSMGGPAAVMYVNLRPAVALTRLTDGTTAIDFEVQSKIGPGGSARIQVTETPEEILEQL